jgi:hypothetical protein
MTAALAAYIDRVVNPPVDNVVPFGPVPVHARSTLDIIG